METPEKVHLTFCCYQSHDLASVAGVFPFEGHFTTYINITKIPELFTISTSSGYTVGGALSLTSFIASLESQATEQGYAYCGQMAKHLKKVASTNVRNMASIAGNLMLKHDHPEFPSDVFVLLEAIDAQLGIMDTTGTISFYTPADFLQTDMTRKILVFASLPSLTDTFRFVSYKVTPRSQNAHAYVNAACLIQVDASFNVVQEPRLVFGGVAPDFIHASETEDYLNGKDLSSEATLQGALAALEVETIPNEDLIQASVAYRKHLVKALFDKVGNHADKKLSDLPSF